MVIALTNMFLTMNEDINLLMKQLAALIKCGANDLPT
jgi:hypothetical protein